MRRGGRFDIDIRMDMPDAEDRYAIFKSHLDSIGHDILISDLRTISRATSGFVSSDLAQIVRNAHISALKTHDFGTNVASARNTLPSNISITESSYIEESKSHIIDTSGEVLISKKNLEEAILAAKPLSIQDLLVEVPKVKWEEIGGNESIIFQVK